MNQAEFNQATCRIRASLGTDSKYITENQIERTLGFVEQSHGSTITTDIEDWTLYILRGLVDSIRAVENKSSGGFVRVGAEDYRRLCGMRRQQTGKLDVTQPPDTGMPVVVMEPTEKANDEIVRALKFREFVIGALAVVKASDADTDSKIRDFATAVAERLRSDEQG